MSHNLTWFTESIFWLNSCSSVHTCFKCLTIYPWLNNWLSFPFLCQEKHISIIDWSLLIMSWWFADLFHLFLNVRFFPVVFIYLFIYLWFVQVLWWRFFFGLGKMCWLCIYLLSHNQKEWCMCEHHRLFCFASLVKDPFIFSLENCIRCTYNAMANPCILILGLDHHHHHIRVPFLC